MEAAPALVSIEGGLPSVRARLPKIFPLLFASHFCGLSIQILMRGQKLAFIIDTIHY